MQSIGFSLNFSNHIFPYSCPPTSTTIRPSYEFINITKKMPASPTVNAIDFLAKAQVLHPQNNDQSWTDPKFSSRPIWRRKKMIRRPIILCASNTYFTRIAANEERLEAHYNQKSTWRNTDNDFHGGRLVRDGLVYRQKILVRSFDVGSNCKISLRALMNNLQDTALSHMRYIGLLADGFGSTPEMIKKDLVWVVNSIKIDINRYPIWTDTVQIDTWMYASGKNSLGCNWLVFDCKTGETLIRATSLNVMMNKKTRKLSKFIKEVKDEIAPHFLDHISVVRQDSGKIFQQIDVNTADNVCIGLTPGWDDMDLNQHVSHVKYTDWIIGSTPRVIMDSYELSDVTLKYRKECHRDSVLQSLSKITMDGTDVVELEHMLCLENGLEVVRARTNWKRIFKVINGNQACQSGSSSG